MTASAQRLQGARCSAGEAQIGLWVGLADAYAAELLRHHRLRLAADRRRARAQRSCAASLAQLQALAPIRSHPVVRPVAGRRRADQAVPRHRRADAARADGRHRRAGRGRWSRAMRYPPRRRARHGQRRWRAPRAGTRSRTTSSTPTTRSACWCRSRRRRAMDEPGGDRRGRGRRRRLLRARPTSRPRWVISAGRSTPTCSRRSTAASPRVRAAGKAPGILVTERGLARRYLDAGALFVAVGLRHLAPRRAAARALAAAFGRGAPD